MDSEAWITAKEIAAYLKVSVGTVQTWCLTGDLPHVRLGGGRDIRSRASLLDAWMAAQQQQGECNGRSRVQRLRKQRALPKKQSV